MARLHSANDVAWRLYGMAILLFAAAVIMLADSVLGFTGLEAAMGEGSSLMLGVLAAVLGAFLWAGGLLIRRMG